MNKENKNICFAYEYDHLDYIQEKSQQGITVLCLDFFLERELKRRHIPFFSLQDLLIEETETEKWWQLTHQIAREWYRLPTMNFFKYDGIRIAEAPEPVLQEYLSRLFYYLRIFLFLKKKYEQIHLFIPASSITDSSSASCLAFFMPRAIIFAAHMANISYETNISYSKPDNYTFPKSTWKSFLIDIFNFVVKIFPSRNFKIYVTEYWKFFCPVIPFLRDVELVILESQNFYRIPWRQIIKHRITIQYPHGPIDKKEEIRVRKITTPFLNQWLIAKKEVFSYLVSIEKDLNWEPVLEVFEYLIIYAPRVVADIRALQKIMKKENPNLIIQMASVGGPQHYFFLLARVATSFKIPSLELQHAGATIDPRSVYCRIETDYLATYGQYVNKWHEQLGQPSKRLIPIGSPRFDRYINGQADNFKKGKELIAKLGLDPNRQVLFVVVPFADTFASALDSYQLADFCKMIRLVQQAVPGLQILFKFRTSRHIGGMRNYIQELFPIDYAMAGDEDIFQLLCVSDGAVCNNSTTIYQILLAQKPLVLCPWKVFDIYHAQVYSQAAPLFYNSQEAVDSISQIFTNPFYRDELLVRQRNFLKNYSFDGKSSERVAKLIFDLGKGKKH